MTSHALQFWDQNAGHFDLGGRGLYDTGYSGWALKLARWMFSVMGVGEDVKRMCEATTIEEQVKVYKEKVCVYQRFLTTDSTGNVASMDCQNIGCKSYLPVENIGSSDEPGLHLTLQADER
jgi:hypothetical protein